MLDWQFKHYSELSTNEFHDIIALRIKVFVVEQNCPYQELDGRDKTGYHLICSNIKGELVGTLRVLPPDLTSKEVRLGRIVLAMEERGNKKGHQMIKKALSFCKKKFSEVPIALSGQKHLEQFYNQHCFYSTGKEYLEDNIPHVEMRYKP